MAGAGSPGGTSEHSAELAEEILKEGLPHVSKNLKDPESVANAALKEGARELERREAQATQDHAVHKGGLAAEAQSAAAHRLHPEQSEVAALVRRRVAAEVGGSAAEELADAIIEAAAARAVRRPMDKRPHTVEEVLQSGASELEHQESLDGRPHQHHSLAARAQARSGRGSRWRGFAS